MKDPHLSTITVSLLTVLALYFPLSSVPPEAARPNAAAQQSLLAAQAVGTSSPNVKSSQDSPSSEQEKSEKIPLQAFKLLCDFFGLKNKPLDKDRAQDQAQDEDDYCSLAGHESQVIQKEAIRYQVEHLIATIADPKDSRLDYLFDRNLDAIQRAIEAPGYVLDRHWLPWKKQQNPQAQGLTAPPQPSRILILTSPDQVRTLPPRMHPDYTRKPGVILFRQIKGDRGKLLVLFLVGETPTRGDT
jgi:hypothetical protein